MAHFFYLLELESWSAGARLRDTIQQQMGSAATHFCRQTPRSWGVPPERTLEISGDIRWDQPLSDHQLQQLLARDGIRAAKHFTGDFALVVRDPRSGKLTAARDRFGTKPLYYRYRPGHYLALCSRLRPLLYLAPFDIDNQRAALFLQGINVDRAQTFIADIKRLPPSHVLELDPHGGLAVTRYFEWPPEGTNNQLSPAAQQRGLIERLRTSVKQRLRGVERCALSLSAGLDSTAVLAVAQQTETEIVPVTMHYPHLEAVDECAPVDALLARHGLPPTRRIDMSAVSAFSDPATFCGDKPPVIPTIPLLGHLLRATANLGFQHIVTGNDGDVVLSSGQFATAAWLRHGRPDRALLDLWLTRKRNALSTPWLLTRGIRSLQLALRVKLPGIRPAPLLSRWGKQLVHGARLRGRFDHRDALEAAQPCDDYELYDELADRAGLVPLHAFLQLELALFCLSLPGYEKRQCGFERPLLRRAFESFRGHTLSWQTKHTLIPWAEHAYRGIEAKQIRCEIEGTLVEQLIDAKALPSWWSQQGATLRGQWAWRLIALAKWLRALPVHRQYS